MKKFEGILFCTDLDGTLYTSDKKVSRENLEAIEYFKSEGGLFTFITGRPSIISTEIYDIVKPNAPYGCFNGAGIYSPKEEKLIWNLALPSSFLELIKDVDEKLPEIGIQFSTANKIYFCKNNSAMVRFRELTGLENIECFYKDVNEEVIKVVFGSFENEQILALETFLKNHPKADDFDFIRSERILYEILPKGASKGQALGKLAEILGINLNRTIAVGDYNNDISMLKSAGIGFAVENAVEEVKAVADYITVSNNHHAIADIIGKLDRREIII